MTDLNLDPMRAHNSTRNNQKISSGAKVMSITEYYEVELATVTNSLCEEKMKITLLPNQMCAGGEKGRDYCQGEHKTNQTVLQKLTSSDKEKAKQS